MFCFTSFIVEGGVKHHKPTTVLKKSKKKEKKTLGNFYC
jgi:hypothetical protein